ncbi:MAG: adenylate/guanylate cyclase domain-containing protein [Desulfobacterales bacterium]|nr:adenylate/guanylate cyclase domain-containing protein [Desulfobacterales bacterium]
MTEKRARRKLSGILSADAVGYSRLMQEDEALTIRRLEDSKKLMSSHIQQYRGRVVDAPGDNMLAEFGSVVEATECAVKIQNDLNAKNADLPDNCRMPFRIGINLGDVVEENDRIYGDGINITARIEGLADPGGICISRTAYDHVKNKLELGYEYMGEHSVKNISEPVRVYRVLMEPGASGKVIGEKRFIGRISRRTAITAIIILIVIAGGLVGWNFYLHQSKRVEPANLAKMAFPLPDKPSIAVLPFTNMSGDPEQEYFSDGITEDLITDLSKISELFVIARNSVFTYKGKSVKISQVAEELGVQYVLEGSVRRADDQVRINTQLIDATTGGHLWAERYDGMMENVFGLQDKITQKIVAALKVTLTAEEEKQTASGETSDPAAYDAFLKGWAHYRRKTLEDFAKAVPYLDEAVERDPSYSRAYAALAAVYWEGSRYRYQKNLYMSRPEADLMANIYLAEAMQIPTSLAHYIASDIHRFFGRHQEAITEATRAIALDANDPVGFFAMASALIWAGNPVDGADFIKKAMRLDPHYPPDYLYHLGKAQFFMGQFDEAAATLEEVKRRFPDYDWTFFYLAAIYGHLGREQEAKSAIKMFDERMTNAGSRIILSLQWIDLWPFKERKDIERLREGLRIAGVPEQSSG